jgi:hypothetical protein
MFEGRKVGQRSAARKFPPFDERNENTVCSEIWRSEKRICNKGTSTVFVK